MELTTAAFLCSAGSITLNTVITGLPSVCRYVYDWYKYKSYTDILKSSNPSRFYQIMFMLDDFIKMHHQIATKYNTQILTINMTEDEKDTQAIEVFSPGGRITFEKFKITIEVLGEGYEIVGFRCYRHRTYSFWWGINYRVEDFLNELDNKIVIKDTKQYTTPRMAEAKKIAKKAEEEKAKKEKNITEQSLTNDIQSAAQTISEMAPLIMS